MEVRLPVRPGTYGDGIAGHLLALQEKEVAVKRIQNSRFKIQNDKQSRVVSNYSRLLFMGVMGIIGIMR